MGKADRLIFGTNFAWHQNEKTCPGNSRRQSKRYPGRRGICEVGGKVTLNPRTLVEIFSFCVIIVS
jgi:hypothetical protein